MANRLHSFRRYFEFRSSDVEKNKICEEQSRCCPKFSIKNAFTEKCSISIYFETRLNKWDVISEIISGTFGTKFCTSCLPVTSRVRICVFLLIFKFLIWKHFAIIKAALAVNFVFFSLLSITYLHKK